MCDYECPRCIAREILFNIIDEVVKPRPIKLYNGDIGFAVGKKYKHQGSICTVVKISKARKTLTFMLDGNELKRKIRINFILGCEYVSQSRSLV